MPSDTEARAKTVLSTPEAWKEVQNCGGWKSFNSVRRSEKHARLSLVMSKIPPELLRHWKRLQRVRSLDLLKASDDYFLCILTTARPVGTILSGHGYAVLFPGPSRGPAFDVGQPGVASTVLKWLAAGRVLGLWSGTPSLNSVQRNSQVLHAGRFLCACAALGISAGEHSPFDSSLRTRPLIFVFENTLVCYSFTVAHHRVVRCHVVLLTEFAPSLDYYINIGKILDKLSSPRW